LGKLIIGSILVIVFLQWCSSERTSILDPAGFGYDRGYESGLEDGIQSTCYDVRRISSEFHTLLRERRVCY
jgi:hypothetical protein